MSVPGTAKTGFTLIEHGAADIVLAASFSLSGTRITLCSADHKIRVFDLDEKESWSLTDQWRGHDAEVLDVSSSPSVSLPYAEVNLLRSNGLGPRSASYLVLLVVTINSSFGEKTHLRHLEVAAASSVSFLNRQAIMSPMSLLTSRPSGQKHGWHCLLTMGC